MLDPEYEKRFKVVDGKIVEYGDYNKPVQKNTYSESIMHIPASEPIMKLIEEECDYFSLWKDQPPLSIFGFGGYVVKPTNVKNFMNTFLHSDLMLDIQVKTVAISVYSSPGNVRTTEFAELVLSSDLEKGRFIFQDAPKRFSGSIFIGLKIINGLETINLHLCFSASHIDQIKEYFSEYPSVSKLIGLERFIHVCKKRAVENYNPELSYTKINPSFIK